MPTYSYACKNCGHSFDIHQGFNDDALTTCPECGQEQLRKVFGSLGVSFKGSGFYRNDSRSSSGGGSGE
ncbi:FmdB family transcriptional regulator [Brevibacterium sp. HMSC08F02]|uniref:FmdB family transcriptional regulator n=1 Tax=Brevibacterium ravenspurgense TaxID=479117 RepID=A0A150H9Z9_9MICO|nr:FmdB family zinc ribbon protein [Brevibacterium sp. HMSC08F02]KXZ58926.1 Zinc ribbon domain protein [Brevibacterium ravenspurgense]OFT26255.1 FmdB family transcriptional regulator [Brevibacterium sp. HMSC08F02]OFT97952.1 FmdB family transcriptional regulator [Brevibacterium sp. HMSC22B09]PKY69501.1 FmdB family transcriptional regulator [Brevibacterium ravenspurgense]